MTFSITSITWAAIALVATYGYQKWAAWRTRRALAITQGCQPPTKYPHKTFSGYDLVEERTAAVKDGRQMELYMKHFEMYGKTWEETYLDIKVINTMEMRNIRHVCATGFEDYGKSSRKLFAPFLGDGIFSQEGPKWKHSRNLIRPTFSRSELSDMDFISVHVDRFLDFIPRDGSTIELQRPLHSLFLDSSSEFLFGQSMNSQRDPEASDEFLQAFNIAMAGVGKRRTAGILSRILYAFDGSWKEAYAKVHAYVDIQVKRALEETSDEDQNNPANDERPTRYILLHEMAKQTRDPIDLRFQILNVFLPAREGMAILVGNAMFHLARNPKIWTQLRDESLGLGDRELNFETLKSLQLFKHVVHEALRLQGPSGRVQRIAKRNTILPVGGGPDGKAPVFVKNGTIVAINIWGLHHDKDIWGDDANDFKPERWVGKRPLWEFVPFIGGPRICPAQQQVLTQSIYLLVRLTRNFARIENRDTILGYVERVRMLTESRNGVQVALFP
ncbi:Cytochrome P450 monooxygenase lepH [Lachnellula suecica]|uniref:Cytochrome P450 monooxygenase lepH n=1 Tax=Lachnellula suecica TaxID=602035 RepID=A0A8T9CJP7_9HELO|nr:Cytochrome P450 monooxygenase lepH [Lachnellula suecica]